MLPSPMAAFAERRRWIGGMLALAAAGCSDDAVEASAPPIAGLEHVAVARRGATVRLSAGPTAIAAGSGAGTRITTFRFAVADGEDLRPSALPQWEHRFDHLGSFGLRLQVQDDMGRLSDVTSRITIVEAYTPSCDGQDVAACASGRCIDGACVRIACAGPPACPAPLLCDQGECRAAASLPPAGDVRYGAAAAP